MSKATAKPKKAFPKGIDSSYELHYLEILQQKKHKGEIQDFHLKPGSLRLGANCHYEPDFLVISADGVVEFHEVKGNTRFAQKSLVKVKVAAHQFPWFTFKLCWGVPSKDVLGKKLLNFDIKEVSE